MERAPTAEQLLADAGWLRRLAARLAGEADADDLVQETWIAAWRRAPSSDRPLRPWLTKVMRDTFRMRRRAAVRREAREARVEPGRATATPEELLEQVRLHQLLVELVLALEEPFRSTLLARFVEGRSAADIAHGTGVAEGTVRWRVHEALSRLRGQLDERTGERTRWAPAVLAFSKGVGMAKASKGTFGVGVLLLLLIGAALLWTTVNVVARRSRTTARTASSAVDRGTVAPVVVQRSEATTTAHPWWEALGLRLHPIRGRVITRDGRALAGATVEVRGWATVGSERPEASLLTGADGAFAFEPTAAAMYTLVASADGRAPHGVGVDPRAPANGVDPEHILLVLDACAATVEGVVTDTGGGPIQGASIRIGGRMTVFSPSTTTDAAGRYTTCVAKEATVLAAGADGYEHVTVPLYARGKQRVDITLAPEGRIVGRLVEEGTNEPIASAQVFAVGVGEDGIDTRYASSADDGAFELDGLAAGRVWLRVWSADHYMFDARELTVVASQTVGPVVVTLPRAATVRGRVVENGKPVRGASVRFWVRTSRGPVDSLRAVTGDDGTFVAINVGPGRDVEVAVHGAVVRSPATIDTTSGLVEGLVVDVEPGVVLRGHVVRHGVRIEGAKVQLRGATRRTETVVTDPDGAFAVAAPDRGPCVIAATSDAVGAFVPDVALSCDQGRDDLTLDLTGGASVEGTVVDQDGAPLTGTVVTVVRTRADDTGGAMSGADGSFLIDELAGGGDYTVTVAASVGGPALPWSGDPPGVLSLRDGDARRTGLVLHVVRRVSSIEGVVVDDRGAPVADATVSALPRAAPSKTDVHGRFALEVVGPGPFRVAAGIGARPRGAVDGVVPGAREVVVHLAGVARLHGTLIDLEGASVNVRSLQNSYMANVEGSTFELADLMPGTYTVLAIARDGRSATGTVMLTAGEAATLTLAATAARPVAGTVVSFDTHAPVAGVRCRAVASSGDVLPVLLWEQGASAVSDASGRFVIEHAPAGDAVVVCDPGSGHSRGIARVAPAADARITIVEHPAMQRLAWSGFVLDSSRILPRIALVAPGGPDIHAGDEIVGVDGQSIQELSSDGVAALIGRKAVGSTVTLQLERAGAAIERTIILGPPGG